jgi:hypothetical protein
MSEVSRKSRSWSATIGDRRPSRQKSEMIAAVIIKTLDIVQCGPGEECYNCPVVAKH